MNGGDLLITPTFYCPGSLGSWDFKFVGWKKIKIKKAPFYSRADLKTPNPSSQGSFFDGNRQNASIL